MKTIKAKHLAEDEPIADLITFRALPTRVMPMNELDPFIFLNHHGWQQYPPHMLGSICSEYQQLRQWVNLFVGVEKCATQSNANWSAAGFTSSNDMVTKQSQFAGKQAQLR